uniref:Secreted protein n=1 Tax=Plectus sambesii TaxID=2011161 RepID=A0A914W145_9BILA
MTVVAIQPAALMICVLWPTQKALIYTLGRSGRTVVLTTVSRRRRSGRRPADRLSLIVIFGTPCHNATTSSPKSPTFFLSFAVTDVTTHYRQRGQLATDRQQKVAPIAACAFSFPLSDSHARLFLGCATTIIARRIMTVVVGGGGDGDGPASVCRRRL